MNNWVQQRAIKRLVKRDFTTTTGWNLGVMVQRTHKSNNTTGSMTIPGMMTLSTMVTGVRVMSMLHNGQMMLNHPRTLVQLVWMPLQMTLNCRMLFRL